MHSDVKVIDIIMRASHAHGMTPNDHITAIQALDVATTEIESLDAELVQLLAAIRAFKGKAARVTRRVHARAEAISDAIHGTREERAAAAPDVEPTPDPAEERILEALAELPSAAPDDCAAAATEALTEYRKALRELAAAAGTLTAGSGSFNTSEA